MGMFDYIKCEYPLPENAPKWLEGAEFQTEDTDAQYMETYIITKEGRFIHKTVRYEVVPENERPYWGKPEWEKSDIRKSCGMIRDIPTGDIDTNYHGDIYFCGVSIGPPFISCNLVARFTEGQLQYIKIVEEHSID